MIDINEIWSKENAYFQNFQNVSLVHGGISIDDLNELEALICKNAYNTNHNINKISICELGSWTGMSTTLFATIAKELEGSVVAVDTFEGAETDNLQTNAQAFDIKKIFMKNLQLNELTKYVKIMNMKTSEAAAHFANDTFDVVFIDADHRYAEIKKDIANWYPKVKQGGIICGHDCDIILTDINALMNKWGKQNYCGFHLGVCRAVAEAFPDAKKTSTGVIWYKKK